MLGSEKVQCYFLHFQIWV